MVIQTLEKEINGAIYTCTQLPARRAIKLKAKLIKLLGPMVAQLFSGGSTDGNVNIVKAVETLAMNLDENVFESLVVEILQGVRKNGMELQPAIIDLEFAGDFASLYSVLWFALEANFASFFTLLGIGKQSPEIQEQAPVMKKTFMRT